VTPVGDSGRPAGGVRGAGRAGPPGAESRGSEAPTGRSPEEEAASGADVDPEQVWSDLNRRYLDLELTRLRLLLRRRILWLRTLWEDGADPLEGYQGIVISDARADRMSRGRGLEAESRFYDESEEARSVLEEVRRVERSVDELLSRMSEAGVAPAAGVLQHLFGLDVFERRVLLLCLAPERDPEFGRLYAYAQDDATLRHATPHLAVRLLAGPAAGGNAGADEIDRRLEDARRAFLRDAPLRRFRLLEPSDGGESRPALAQPLRLPERVRSYLEGVNRLDPAADRMLTAVPELPLGREGRRSVREVSGALSRRLESGGRAAVNVVGPPGAGREAAARALVAELDHRRLYRIDPEALASDRGRLRPSLHLLEREAALLRAGYYLDVGDLPEDREVRRAARRSIEELGGLLVVGSRSPVDADRELFRVRLERPTTQEQRRVWEEALEAEEHRAGGSLGEVIEQFELPPREVARAVAGARRRADRRERGGPLTAEDLWAACRERTGGRLGELAQPIEPSYGWGDIVLPEDALDQLREIAGQVRQRSRVYAEWGFREKLSRGLGVTALFAGPSGTGKTMAAEILADDLGLDLYRIDLASVVSKYIGETEKNLRRVFDAAEASGAILFFDEADALFGKRTEVSDAHDRYANIEVDYLLQRMESYRGLAILATNRKGDLDSAFLRRLRFIVDFPKPDADQRREIWRKVFPRAAPVDGLDWDALARLEVTGGNIRNIAVNAAFLAAGEDEAIRTGHVMKAARREYGKIGKLVTEDEFGEGHVG
jgi:hypothetical protein